MKNNATLVYNACLVVGDFLGLVAAFIGGFLIRAKLTQIPVAHPIHAATYILVFLTILPFWIIIFALIGLYNSQIYERRFSELGRLFIGSFIGLLFVVFWNFLTVKPIFPSKLVPIYGFMLGFFFLVIFRNIARLIRTELFAYNVGLNRVILVGNTSMSHELLMSLKDSKHSGYKVLAVVGGQRALGGQTNVPVYTRFQDALAALKQTPHTIIQTELYLDENKNREILDFAQTNHVAYRFVPGNSELFVGNLEVELFRNSIPVIAINQTALLGWGRIVKRLFDIFVAAVLVVVLSPVFILIALLEKIFDPRAPIFFRQIRLTRYNQQFRVFKFRTLHSQFGKGTQEEDFALLGRPELAKKFRENGNYLANDPRVTKLGRFLRRTSLDELPQLFNVLLGDLSLVGPRALIPQELDNFDKRHTILSVKSGLTGLAQVSGRNNIPPDERRQLDIYYVQNWSFWLDLMIIAKTLRVILEGT